MMDLPTYLRGLQQFLDEKEFLANRVSNPMRAAELRIIALQVALENLIKLLIEKEEQK